MHVELLGIPRERAGLSEVEVEADTLGAALLELAARFPRLGELMPNGALHPSIAVNLNADEFISDPTRALGKDDRLLILSADAGG